MKLGGRVLLASAATALLTVTAAVGTANGQSAQTVSGLTPASVRASAAIVTVLPPALGDAVTVRVKRVVKKAPVTIEWGNGQSSKVATSCTATAAAKAPVRCGGVRTTLYQSPGEYTLRVIQRGSELLTHTITIADTSTPTPTPTPTAEPTPTPTPTETAAPPAPAAWEQDMLSQVNSLRASVGAGPVTLCAPLTRAAQLHSEDMAARDYFSHYTPEGDGPGPRINGQGYFGGWGENIAAGYPDVLGVMSGWINSPGHYANLINPNYTHIGFGKANGGSYGIYWTQNFGYRGNC